MVCIVLCRCEARVERGFSTHPAQPHAQPATTKLSESAGPAQSCAAFPTRTKIPDPMIPPMPTAGSTRTRSSDKAVMLVQGAAASGPSPCSPVYLLGGRQRLNIGLIRMAAHAHAMSPTGPSSRLSRCEPPSFTSDCAWQEKVSLRGHEVH